jgi:hypothetical protein
LPTKLFPLVHYYIRVVVSILESTTKYDSAKRKDQSTLS